MNHQAQTYTLVDGEWVSATVDVYQAMAQARESDTEMAEVTAESTTQVPELGILSSTVFASPLFKFVRPANIRHKHFNDIVLVGDDAIQLKEIRDYGRLRHVATKSDFKGRILAAKVFGDPREIPVNVGSPLPKKQHLQRGRRSMTGDNEQVLPPEVVVLTLTNRTLMFLWAQHTQAGLVSFVQRTVNLPAGASSFDRFGTFLAVDNRRRAMAVAAQEGRFILYKTKSMERWRKELRDGSATTPIEDERIIPIEGRIMHMDFLSSAASLDEYHVVLLFIVALHGKTKITCFDWDCREDLSKVTVRTERVLVDLEDHNPSLLIPLARTSDFLLVFDTHIAAYVDVLSGVPRRVLAQIGPHILQPLLPGDSKRRPRWVAWDKTPRNREYAKEVFYIAREDGRIMYAERGPAGDLEADEAGDWPYRIDTAFACLSVDNSEFSQRYPDVLIAGGASNDGQLCKVGSWPTEYPYARSYPGTNQFSHVDCIPNWAPSMDLSVTRLPGARAPHERDRDSIFIANGASPHGGISEMRHGVQASVEHYFGGMNGCTGLWAVDHGSSIMNCEGKTAKRHYATFAVTIPPETLLIRIVRTQREIRGDFSGAWEDGAWEVEQVHAGEDDVMRDVETILTCSWADGLAIQVTRNEIRVLRRPTLQQVDSIVFPTSLLRVACKPGCPFIAVTFRESGHIYLELVRMSQDGTLMRTASLDARLRLDHDATCVELFEVEGTLCVFTSTFDLKVMLLKVQDDGTLVPIAEDSLESATIDGVRMLLESVVLLSTQEARVLVCATRSGYLLSSPLPGCGKNSSHFKWHTVKMGTTSAQITPSSMDTSSAFVSCGRDFCRVRCSGKAPFLLDIDSIWFTKRTQPDYLQSPITATCQLPHVDYSNTIGRNLGGLLFTVAGDQFLFSQVDSDTHIPSDLSALPEDDCRAVPRKLVVGSKPTSVMYLDRAHKMVTATMQAKEERAPPHGYRVLHSSIKLVTTADEKSADEPETKQENEPAAANKLVAAEYELKHGERVYSITEWEYHDHRGKKYDLLIVGTGVPGSTGKETGRRLIINPGRQGSKLQLQKESSFSHPVYYSTAYNNDRSVSAIGKKLAFDIFEQGALTRHATTELPSPAIHITVRAPFVYVSTLQHSHHCFEIIEYEQDGKTHYEFEKVFQDSHDRNCSSHLVLNINTAASTQDTVILVTDKKSASITALYHPPERTQMNATTTLFEACLPRTVTRLQQGSIRPPWRRSAHSPNPPTGIFNDNIIGLCSDGTIYTFSLLSQPARHLLRFLQNLIEEKQRRDPAKKDIPVRTGTLTHILMNNAEGDQDDGIRAAAVDPRTRERGVGGKRNGHVDGDALRRWVAVDGDVGRLVREGVDASVGRLFGEFMGEMWGGDVKSLDDGVEMARKWMEEILMPVL
ncbi:hypothetical protein CC86DRAFT_413530 [Ophiobolus disseminans]|uniref:Cleavage/polyadenylation specificity factor A subunit N-terminal domain-containing protein n=1 Tax=Ophiobolus disseminans TaxID=1469910 RepID=A0A6A6ZFA5_9PLEO|nr:hypothetical protein CC86DRAFT_413530 [Ophiobolus disseminans]